MTKFLFDIPGVSKKKVVELNRQNKVNDCIQAWYLYINLQNKYLMIDL